MSSATQHPITGRTKVLGLIADPVVQTRSPDLVNAMLERQGRFGEFVLLPMQVPCGAIAETITALRCMNNFAGAIVSMPHKTAIVALLDELTLDARLVGAVNVIRRTVEGRSQSYDIAVNATSLGMNNGDELPIADEIIEASALIVECVIGPEITPLLDLARRKGRAIHTGVHMLEGQLDLMLPFMGVD